MLGFTQALPGCLQVSGALRALGGDLLLLVEVVLFGLGQVGTQRTGECGNQADSNVQAAALPALFDQKFPDLGRHLVVWCAIGETTPDDLVDLMAGFLIPCCRGASLLLGVQGQQEPLRGLG